MARDPATDQATLRAIEETARRGGHLEAAAQAQAALAGGLEHPLILNLAALKLEHQGNLAQAEVLLRRAIAIAPGDIGARNALGLCLMRLERHAEALAQFSALLELDPALPFAHASLGNAYLALDLNAQAEASYRRALELDPNQGPALAGVAQFACNRGEYSEARVFAGRALAAVPGLPDAALVLAATDLGEGKLADAETRVRALLDEPRLSPLENAYANGLLGDVLDAKDYTEEAFAAFTACNGELERIYDGRFAAGPSTLNYVASMNTFFERASPENWRSRPPPDSRSAAAHVFIIGFPRSGATLLEVILSGHGNVASLGEHESMIDAVREFMAQPADLQRFAAAAPSTLERLRGAYWRNVAAAGIDVTGKIFIDKNPLNTLKLPLIARLFPNARILFACRDPRDVVLSCFRHRFKMSAPTYQLLSIGGAASYFDAVMRLTVRLSSMLPLDICLVRHEDVVTEFRREMKRVCEFLNIEWDPAMGDFALRKDNPDSPAPSTAQIIKAMSTEGIGQWRRYRTQLAPAAPVLDPWVKRFYYDD